MQLVVVSCKGALWLPYLLFLVMLYFAQLIYPVYFISIMKYFSNMHYSSVYAC